MAKTKNFSDLMAIRFVFWANISTGLWDPLGWSNLSQIFFGSSPTGIEWDKTVAEIIIKTFVFLGRPIKQVWKEDACSCTKIKREGAESGAFSESSQETCSDYSFSLKMENIT